MEPLIYKDIDNEYWFKKTKNKFLHNIDTFYYSVKLVNDFTNSSSDKKVIKFRKEFSKYDNLEFGSCITFNLPDSREQLNIMPFKFAGYYKYCLECPERFDIFIADTVPKGINEESVTSEIIVQIRSYPLWTIGPVKAFEESFEIVKELLKIYDLDIYEVKENRCDYCWHSNYLQNPSQYFRIDNMVNMQVSHFKRIHYEYQFKPNQEYENDYICMGKRSDKVFVRIYLKSKEVVEKGYKPWFFKTWLFNGLISRYDLYLYEECYKYQSWKHLDLARIKFYSEYGKNQEYIKKCKKLLNEVKSISDDSLQRLADYLTPRITLITNVEFQTTRKSSKSYPLYEIKDNKKFGVAKRIYDYLDNHKIITEYLTRSTLRLVNNDDKNKSRCSYNEFWTRLRSCKFIDAVNTPKYLKLIRVYNRNLSKEVVKRKMLNSAITYSLYVKGINEDSVIDDCAAALIKLNDNDIFNMKRYKDKKKKLLNNVDLAEVIEDNRQSYIIMSEDGEIIE